MVTKASPKKKSGQKAPQSKSSPERKHSTSARTRTGSSKQKSSPSRAKPVPAARTGHGKGKAAAGKSSKPAVKSKSGGKATKLPARKATAPKQSQMESKILKANRTPNRPAKVQAPRSPSDRSSIQPIVEKVPHRASHPTASEQPVREAPAREVKASINGAAKPVTAVLKARVPANESGRKSGDRAGGAAERESFSEGDFVVYPTHGVGRVVAIETQQIAGISLPLIVITFDKDRMTLRVPVAKAHNSGLRKLSSRKVMDTALATLKGRSRVKRTMWSRRAQEYEAKINSGDPVSIAEVVRDLHRGSDQPDQSYSERQIYQAALDRLARELAAVERIDEQVAAQRLEEMLKAA
jgi:CarD family transcriptional regulator